MDQARRGLTEADRRLLDRLVQARAERRLLRSAASVLGLRNPFFLVHEGDAGRWTVIDGRLMINFSCYDYLSLNRHPKVRAAAHAAMDRYGVSAGASRLVAGERPVHRALETALASHYG
jgi:7-keto-8-aminopelargonate synthetase-like enzyme